MGDKHVLLVEGKDDEHVICQLMERHGVQSRPIVKSKGGIDTLLETLDVELIASDLQCLGIVVDADVDLLSRWRSIRNILLDAGYNNIPEQINEDGIVIFEDRKPDVGIWLMPNNNLNGMLEDFLKFLIPNGNNNILLNVAKQVVNNLPKQEELPAPEKRFSLGHKSKAILHTWLAWQESPGKPFGVAIKARFLDADATEAIQFVAWLRRLYSR
ncbi:MAG: hypothetical protein EI684_03105 [Candidatus Viridilinea halotolerans]|uniref:DUF4435 domain-containing protein n=1 Tax=Candidatus Viridilinea halotolerans TaxID=2491704 RepID=A0A426U839_9CHLR|nr:MAG: hypothetical protein EI684_03105 [Candidatus Viridilinea halotolerans]